MLFNAAVNIQIHKYRDADPLQYRGGELEARIIHEAGEMVDHMVDVADIYDEESETDENCPACGMKH